MTQGILWLKFADIKRIACAYFRRIYIYLNVACTIHSVCSLSHCFFFCIVVVAVIQLDIFNAFGRSLFYS